jgi:hypothetical protein
MTAVTPEMIEAGVQASGQWFMDARRNDRVEAAIYLAMKALDPEYVRLVATLGVIEEHRTERACRTAEEECEHTLREVQAMALEALSQTQSQAPDSAQ